MEYLKPLPRSGSYLCNLWLKFCSVRPTALYKRPSLIPLDRLDRSTICYLCSRLIPMAAVWLFERKFHFNAERSPATALANREAWLSVGVIDSESNVFATELVDGTTLSIHQGEFFQMSFGSRWDRNFS